MNENISARLRALASRISGLFSSGRLDRDFEEELDSHLAMLTEENIRLGMPPNEAKRAAHLKLGGAAQLRETHHDQRTFLWLESLWQDIHFAARMLRKNPGFTAVAVITLALGIGANTAIFTLIDAVILRMLPVQRPEQLVELHITGSSFSYPAYERLRDGNQVFSGMLAVSSLYTPLHATTTGETETAIGQYVSGNFFSVLGVQPVIGRTLIPADDNPSTGGDASVAVISYGFWQRRFGADASAIGKQVEIEGIPFTIVGVTPPQFSGLQIGNPEQFWIPVSAEPLFHTPSWLPRRSYHWLYIVGRLKPGVSAAQAQTNAAVIFNQILSEDAASFPNAHQKQVYLSQTIEADSAGSGLSRLRRQFSKPLLILMVLVGLVLLVACANVASLLLARAASRHRELAVRLALGASRWRLIRQVLTESVLLSVLGGLAGLTIAFFAGTYLVTFMSSSPVPVVLNLHPDVRVLAFATLAALFTAILFGLAPAFRATQVDAGPALKERGSAGSRHGSRLGKLLIVSQIALSLVLLVGAGLFVGTLRNLKTFDPGFNSEGVLLAIVNPGRAGFTNARLVTFYQQLIERLEQQPGIVSTSLSMVTPVAGGGVDLSASVEGYAPRPDEDNSVYVNRVSPGYFATVGTPLLLGRDFTPLDTQSSPKVALINETMAKYYFHGESPMGRHVTLGRAPLAETFEVVGVVKDSKYMSLREPIHRTIFTDCFQMATMPGSLDLELRSAGNPLNFVPIVRSEVSSFSGAVALADFSTLDQQIDRSLTQERLVATLSGFLGALALLLACIGLYGLMSYSVDNRTSEIGIRMALGAERGTVVSMILRESMVLVTVGILIGVPAAIMASRVAANQISGLLFGVAANNATTFAFASAALIVSAALASALPALRASRVDPMVALRHE